VTGEFTRSSCEICEEGCYRESLHRLSPLAVLLDRMEWPHTHGRIELRKGTRAPWVAQLENRKSPRIADDTSFWFAGDTRSTALRTAVTVCLEDDVQSDDLRDDPLAVRLDALPEWPPWDRIVLRRDQLHIYVYTGSHTGGHGLAEALYNTIAQAEA
jgi:hypothetical protein